MGTNQQPQATLMSAMPNPLVVLWNAWYWSRDQRELLHSHVLPTMSTTLSMKLVRHAVSMLKDHVPITEGIMLMWGISQIPRSMQEQLVRTRHAAFFAEGHRIADKSNFFDEGAFFDLPKEYDSISTGYYEAMQNAQSAYRSLVGRGIPREIARGVLPMHVHSRIVMFINLREFARMMGTRTCHIAQGSYWQPLMADMKRNLNDYFKEWGDEEGQICEYIFRPPCALNKICITPQEAENRLTGRDIFPPCPLYTEEIRRNSNA